jgi:hypothetical protein
VGIKGKPEEFPNTVTLVLYPIDFGTDTKFVMFPYVPEKFREKIITELGENVHETDGQLVVDLGRKTDKIDIDKWFDVVKEKLAPAGLTSGNAFPLPWSDESEEPSLPK